MKNRRVIAAFATGALAAMGVGVAVGSQSGGTAQGGEDFTKFAALNGAKEIGTDGQRNAGDANGYGSFSATIDGNKLCYGLTVANIGKPVAAHPPGRTRRQRRCRLRAEASEGGRSWILEPVQEHPRVPQGRHQRHPETLLRERAQLGVPGRGDSRPTGQLAQTTRSSPPAGLRSS
jgi:hypothetical protein